MAEKNISVEIVIQNILFQENVYYVGSQFWRCLKCRLTVRDVAELYLASEEEEELVVDRERLQQEARLVNVTSVEVR